MGCCGQRLLLDEVLFLHPAVHCIWFQNFLTFSFCGLLLMSKFGPSGGKAEPPLKMHM